MLPRFALLALLALPACCAPDMIEASAVQPAFTLIRARHDAYVKADQTLDEDTRDRYLRTTELFQLTLDEAQVKEDEE